ncbi:hypothetical protein BAC3_00814 [uncultured bacterium]|nr:hypothetical protein BAC3_00814 [uncultured bacterium]
MQLYFLLGLLFMLCGCSANTVKQLAYDTVQDMHQQQCQKNLSLECRSQSYDEYQRDLKEIHLN